MEEDQQIQADTKGQFQDLYVGGLFCMRGVYFNREVDLSQWFRAKWEKGDKFLARISTFRIVRGGGGNCKTPQTPSVSTAGITLFVLTELSGSRTWLDIPYASLRLPDYVGDIYQSEVMF